MISRDMVPAPVVFAIVGANSDPPVSQKPVAPATKAKSPDSVISGGTGRLARNRRDRSSVRLSASGLVLHLGEETRKAR
jgi:hypothetical protein